MTENASDRATLDAQAAAGGLAQIFSRDVTAAIAACAGCGREGALGELPLYGSSMGVVIRCRGCDAVLIRQVTTPHGIWFEMQGMRRLVFAP